MASVVAPYLPHERLRAVADSFLKEHHPSGELPVPIEEIIEFDFGLDIVPMPGLKSEFDVDAFITSALSEIRVDGDIYSNRPNRYRFSLAHELAHLLIHQDVFKAMKFTTIREWKAAICSIPERQYFFIEQQAYTLAGLILVPKSPLVSLFQESAEKANAAGLDIQELDPKFRRSIESSIGRHFDVSADVVARRLKSEKLWSHS